VGKSKKRIMIKKRIVRRNNCVFFPPFILFLLVNFSSFGQLIEFDSAVKMPAILNSPAEESLPLISRDKQTLYFVRSLFEKNTKGEKGGQDIWMSKLNSEGKWSEPTNELPNINSKGNNAVVGFNASGDKIFLLNTYKMGESRNKGISYSNITGGGFSKPLEIPLHGIYPKGSYYSFYMHPSEKILLLSMDGEKSLGKEDIYVILKDSTGNWGAPIHLGPAINTPGFEISPWLSKDGLTLFFSSNAHEGRGDADIYMSRRLYRSWNIWTKPVNLGQRINSKKFDAYFSMADDSTVFFVSNRDRQTSDLYQSKLRKQDIRKLLNITEDDIPGPQFLEGKKYKKAGDGEINKFLGVSIPRVVYFPTNSYDISVEDKELIFYITSKLEGNKTFLLELIGHTDREGTEEYNMDLSKKRAQNVKDFFVSLGVDPQRISTAGKGFNQPAVKETDQRQNQLNRRVEINFLK
jgi:outer membrane protein OmpA-like peptidoglycan-associated protein